MIDRRFRVPLSPPTSPRMSDSVKTAEYQNQHASKAHAHSEYYPYREQSDTSLEYREDGTYSHDPVKSSLHSYKSFAYSPGPPGGSCHQYNPESYSQHASSDYQQRRTSPGPHSMGSTDFQPATYGASAPESPDDRLTPRSPDTSAKGQNDEEDLIDSAGDDQDEGSEKVQMTAAELRAHKRKMKRFRYASYATRTDWAAVLTIAQTYTQPDSFSCERVCPPSPSRCWSP